MGKKEKMTIRISPKTERIVEENYKRSGCRSRSEFIEKAMLFYCGFLDAEKPDEYIPPETRSVLYEMLGKFERRMGSLLFRLAVEKNITNHILAADSDLDMPLYERLCNRSLREVQETNGKIDLRSDPVRPKSF